MIELKQLESIHEKILSEFLKGTISVEEYLLEVDELISIKFKHQDHS
jgi:hypothetical protein